MSTTKEYWSQRYHENNTGWDLGAPSPPLQNYVNQLTDKHLKILIPGACNSYEAEYLFKNGFTNVHVLDIAKEPLESFRKRNPNFLVEQLHEHDFFEFEGQYDLILEQTFFCSFPPLPETRKAYAQKMHQLLKLNGKLVGLWFNFPLTGDLEKRPFGGDMEEYLSYLSPYFEVQSFESCYNSIPPRQGNELFGIFRVKK